MYQRILVPFDGSATSARGLREAIQLARLTGARVRLVHVIDDLSFAQTMEGYSGSALRWHESLRLAGERLLALGASEVLAAGLQASTALHDTFAGPVQDHVAVEVRNWGADLIVMGTHGRRGVGRTLLGSTAEQVLRTAAVPVLLVRAPEPQAATGIEQPPAAGAAPIVMPTPGAAFAPA